MRRRCQTAQKRLVRRLDVPDGLPDDNTPLVLLADGLWFRFRQLPWVLYDMAFKPVDLDTAFFLDPVLLPGDERAERWRKALATIPEHLRKRTRALVSDGFRGSKAIARKHGWVHQRCHFHLKATLASQLGRCSPGLRGIPVRRTIYRAVCEMLEPCSEDRLARLRQLLLEQSRHPDCPRRMGGAVREAIRNLLHFRAYLHHPELCLPTTVCAVESMHNLIRRSVTCINSPQALLLRCRSFLRLQPTIVSNGAKIPQK